MWNVFLSCLFIVGAAPAGEGPPATPAAPDATLRNTADEPVLVSQFRGKPSVLLYEDRHSTEVNRSFKTALRAREQGPHGADVQVLAVANLSGLNFFPIRGFALHGVREAERKAQHPLLVDWENALTRPPWSLPPNGSTVVVLSPTGDVVFTQSGALDAQAQEQVFALLGRFLPQELQPVEAHATSR